MIDDASNRSPANTSLAFPAVLVPAGEDPRPALRQAGIIEPLALPFTVGDGSPGAQSGDSINPNMPAELETAAQDGPDWDSPDWGGPDWSGPDRDGPDPEGPDQEGAAGQGSLQNPPEPDVIPASAFSASSATRMLPPAYGIRPLAPVRPRGS